MAREYDHIVVGGGAAGCVAAVPLARDRKSRVLPLEAGHSNKHALLDMDTPKNPILRLILSSPLACDTQIPQILCASRPLLINRTI